MPDRAQRLVAVLHEHPLLGEGIARILSVETDSEVSVVSVGDRCAVEAVLARKPSVVIFEGSQCERDCRRLVPQAILIDVTSAMSTRTDPSVAPLDLKGIMLAARGDVTSS